MPRSRLLAATLLATSSLALVLVDPAPASAQAVDGQALIRQGVDLRRAGDDIGALARFQQAWQASHSSEALAQMALAEQALGQWVNADGHLREALATTGSAWIDRNRGALEASLGIIAQHVGRLIVTGTPAGASVRVNGNASGTLPLSEPIRLLAETVRVEVAAPHYLAVTRSLPIPAGVISREVFDLEPEPPPAPTTPPDGTTPTEPAHPVAPVAAVPAGPPPIARGRLIVDASDPNAMVSIDHRAYGAGHVETALPVGQHFVEIRATGYLPYRRTVAVEEMGLLRIDASLQHPPMAGWIVPVVVVGSVLVVAAAVTVGVVAATSSPPYSLFVPSLGNVTEQAH